MKIERDEKAGKFVTALDGDIAYIQYEEASDGTLDLTHTIVPAPHEGKGIASDLTRHVLDYARTEGVKVIATCSFVSQWVERNPEYRDLLAQRAAG